MSISRTLLLLVLATAAVACAAEPGAAPAAEDEIVGPAAAARLERADFPAGDFRTRTEELHQEWLDNNIMTGDARLDAGNLTGTLTSASLEKFAMEAVTSQLELGEMTLRDGKATSPRFTETVVKTVAKVVAVDGFVFDPSNPENIEPIEANVRELLAFVGDKTTLDVAKVTGKTTHFDATRNVTCWVFVNRETKAFVAFYAREGSV